MKTKKFSLSNHAILLSIIVFAAVVRITAPAGYSINFSPIDAIALFSGALCVGRFTGCIITLSAVLIGDLGINRIFFDHWVFFYSGFYWQYSAYILIVIIGSQLIKNVTPIRVFSASIASSILFFIVSNFGVWFNGILYPFNVDGLITCYIAAIPFFKNTLFSDLFYSMLLFGSFSWAHKKYFTPATVKI
jgi:hypothetical protein